MDQLVVKKANDVISSLVDDGIVAIDGYRQQTGNFESTTINGMKTAVVYNSTNFRTAYMPFSYTLKASFVDNTGFIDINNLSKKNFTLGNISDNIEPQYTDMKFETEKKCIWTKSNKCNSNCILCRSIVNNGCWEYYYDL